ncbi:polyprenyl synthetase family protein [Nocardioides sp. CFH 31398]|uniref:polyprenyl synthetase family protein n=1 Tax=Nocardioides sp. CFH 31398 TaxID=2919579 RepID=UPI001F06CEDD|nr:polyprenyl synthetase family protein [Nocardioides sp. CFH 31398]MCH1865579.1 polyprenyl synthetase family protein [Nocardioides sp. CFH 31398]
MLRRDLERRGRTLLEVSPELSPMVDALVAAGRGGKRLRATFALLGARSVAGGPVPGDVEVGAALEMFHLAALVHDDLMDRSVTRRGEPTVHRRFGDGHLEADGLGDPEHFGTSMAVLAGDLCLTWSDDLLAAGVASADAVRAGEVRTAWSRMRDETLAGQYLDVLGHTRAAVSPSYARRVLRYKSAAYTVQQPLLLGARLAGAPAPLLAAFSDIGLAAGEAFQLRDDVLGVLGDPTVTGKPVLDDVREGKRTVLVAVATDRATPAQREVLDAAVGDPDLTPDGLAAVQEVLVATGAASEVEDRITTLATRALTLTSTLDVAEEHAERLAALIGLCAWRDA